jgi:type VI secretion system protein VasD
VYAPPGQQPPPGYAAPGQPLPPYVTPGKPPAPAQAAAPLAPQPAPQQQALAPPAAPAPMPSVAEMSFFVGADVNPDRSGRPSPVIVRTYELKSLVAFNGADFFSMFEREKEIIGPDLVARDEWALMPGNNRQVIKNLQKDTRYVGVVAAFRDLDRSQWRAATLILPNQTSRVEIRLDRNELNVRLH